jgi:hypothetical protein
MGLQNKLRRWTLAAVDWLLPEQSNLRHCPDTVDDPDLDGEPYRTLVPADSVSIPCALSFPAVSIPLGCLDRPMDQDGKWTTYFVGGHLCFVRSASGALILRAKPFHTDDLMCFDSIEASPTFFSLSSHSLESQVRVLFEHLVWHIVVKRQTAHRDPGDLASSLLGVRFNVLDAPAVSKFYSQVLGHSVPNTRGSGELHLVNGVSVEFTGKPKADTNRARSDVVHMTVLSRHQAWQVRSLLDTCEYPWLDEVPSQHDFGPLFESIVTTDPDGNGVRVLCRRTSFVTSPGLEREPRRTAQEVAPHVQRGPRSA